MNLKVIYSSLLILLVSCTSELPQAPDLVQGQEPGVPVSFIYTVESKADFDSRAPIEYSYLPENSKIGIYALGGTANENNEFICSDKSNTWAENNLQQSFLNACYTAQTETYNGTSIHRLNADGPTGTFPNAENAALMFYAYYPYTNEVQFERGLLSPIAPKIPIRIENINDETPDYLYTGPITAKASSNEPTQLTFEHALAKLEIYITTDNDFTYRKCPKVTLIEIGTNYPQEGTLDISTGEILPNENSEYWDFSKETSSQNIHSLNNNTLKCSFLLFPGVNPIYYLRFYIKTTLGEEKVFELNAKNTTSLKTIELKQGYTTKLYLTYKLDY